MDEKFLKNYYEIVDQLRENNINADDLSIKQFPSGYSNLTYFLKSSSEEFVLRRPPFGAKSLKGGHDMLREYNVLKNLKSQFLMPPVTDTNPAQVTMDLLHFCQL